MMIKDLLTVIDRHDTDIRLHFYFCRRMDNVWKRKSTVDVICQGYKGLMDALAAERIHKSMNIFHVWLAGEGCSDRNENTPVLWVGVADQAAKTEEN